MLRKTVLAIAAIVLWVSQTSALDQQVKIERDVAGDPVTLVYGSFRGNVVRGERQ